MAHLDSKGSTIHEWFGPTGFFTVPAIDPQDPTQVWYNPQSGFAVLASIDYAAGSWKVLETYKLGGMADGLVAEEIGGKQHPAGGALSRGETVSGVPVLAAECCHP